MGKHSMFNEPLKNYVSRRLDDIDIGRVELSRKLGKSLSYLSQVESGSVNFNEALCQDYIVALGLDQRQTDEFCELVRFLNAKRKAPNSTDAGKRLSAIVAIYGDELDQVDIEIIEEMVAQGLGKQSDYRKGRNASPSRMTPERFLEIFYLAMDQKNRIAKDDELVPVCRLVEKEAAVQPRFKLTFHDKMPERLGDVWACVEHHVEGREAHFLSQNYERAFDGCSFNRHVVAHEFGHYILEHKGINFLKPTMIGKTRSTGSADDPVEELEADIFATLLLVPWRRMVRGDSANELAKRFHAEKKWITKASGMLKVPIIKRQITNSGQ